MKKSTIAEEIEYFQALNYDDKLRYFDDCKVNFLYDTYSFGSNELFVTIKPSTANELKKYNRWIIDKWRLAFHEDLKQLDVHSFKYPFKYFDELKGHFTSKIKDLAYGDKLAFIEKEIEVIGKFVAALKIGRKIVVNVNSAVIDGKEEDIYVFKTNLSTILGKAKNIAKILDILKYRAFLTCEKRKLNSSKSITSELKIKIDEEKAGVLFDYLLDEKFIDVDTSRYNFIKIITGQPIEEGLFIKWIDRGSRNRYVNKLTLMTLIDKITIGEVEERNTFLKGRFKLYQLKKMGAGERELVDLTTVNLKNARQILYAQVLNIEGTGERQSHLQSMLKNLLD